MKSFNTFIWAASAALTAAQVISNGDGTFTCPIANGAYCAGDSLITNIIIRCTGTVGRPGNCNNNLSGQFPRGVNFAPCWEPFAASGQAACSKNCIVYGSSGAYNGTFTLPGCIPTTTESTSASTTSKATTNLSVSVTSSAVHTSYTTLTNDYTTVTVPCISGTPIYTPPGVTFPTAVKPTGHTSHPTGGPSGPIINGTNPTSSSGSGPGGAGSATATPVGPTTSAPIFTGAAATNQVGLIAAAGLFAAYLL